MAEPGVAPTARTEASRLFFALWPNADLRAAITRSAFDIARQRALGGREIPPERVHLTLLFLGNVMPEARQRLVDAAARVQAPTFHLLLDQAGCFYRSRVFWLGASTAPLGLTVLWRELQAVAAAAGIEPDRKLLVPHVTCVRDIKHRIRPVAVTPVSWPVREFALVHSVPGQRPAGASQKDLRSPALGHGPSEYHVVSQWPLQTGSVKSVKTVQEPGGPE